VNIGNFVGRTGIVVLALAFTWVSIDPAAAQTNRQRRQMIKLAEVMGGLHHVRGACYRPEQNEWRVSFYRMLDLQNPDRYFRARLVEAFQSSYAEHRRRYGPCDQSAARRAAKLAQEGEELSRELMFEYR